MFNLRISRGFRFIQFDYTVRNIANRIRKTASKFERIGLLHALTQPLYSLPLPLNFAPFNSLKPNTRTNNEEPNEHKTNENLAEQKDG